MAATLKVRRGYCLASGLFVLPILCVLLTLNSAFGVGGHNPGAEAAFLYLLLWPLQIPLVVMLVLALRGKRKSR